MENVPLLSNAYGAALREACAVVPEANPRHHAPASSAGPPIQTLEDKDSKERCEIPVARDGGPEGILTPNDEDDMETGRTRPLRLDQVHF